MAIKTPFKEAAYDVSQIKGQIIIAAKDLLPSETIQLDRDRVLGFVTSGGSQVSHSSILARTMGIPSLSVVCKYRIHIRRMPDIPIDFYFNTVLCAAWHPFQRFAMEDAYLRERSADMIDISSRVVRLLQGEAAYDVSQISR